MRLIFKILILFLIIIAVLFSFVFAINYSASGLESPSSFYTSSDKLWKHRVLNSSDANRYLEEFDGIEIDIFYDSNKNKFDIHHDGRNSGLSLADYMADIYNISEHYYWLDFKNLDDSNVINSMQQLEILAQNYEIKDKLIIESRRARLLYEFSEKGFYTSYWLLKPKTFKNFKTAVNLLRFRPTVISCSYEHVIAYSKKYPLYNIHCWANDMTSEEDKLEIEKLCGRDNVKIMLTDMEVNFLRHIK